MRVRYELATLLGFKSHAEFRIDDRMAGDVTKVDAFLKDLKKKLTPIAKKELEVLTSLKGEETGKKEVTLNSWDLSYYQRLLKEQKYQVDSQEVKEYFPWIM